MLKSNDMPKNKEKCGLLDSKQEAALNGKKIALFGSYGWGDGEWMRSWEDRCKSDGAVLACDSVICNEAPDELALDECKALGAALS